MAGAGLMFMGAMTLRAEVPQASPSRLHQIAPDGVADFDASRYDLEELFAEIRIPIVQGDFDGNGQTDLARTNTKRFDQPGGAFELLLSNRFPTGLQFAEQRIDASPDGLGLVGDVDGDGHDDLVFFKHADASVTQISEAFAPSGAVFNAVLSSDGDRAIYLGDLNTAGTFELYFRPTDLSASQQKISAPLVVGGDVFGFDAHFGSGQTYTFVYHADGDTNGVNELIGGSDTQPAIKLSGPLVSGGQVLNFQLTDDGQDVVYLATQLSTGHQQLFYSHTDGSEMGELISQASPVGQVFSYKVAPGGGFVVYRGNPEDGGVSALYTTPIGAVALQTKFVTPSGGKIYDDFDISADGKWTVFRGDGASVNVAELYTALTDGTGPVTRVHPAFNVTRDVLDFKITPDSRFVVYRSDELIDNVFDLFIAELGTSGEERLVSDSLGGSRDVLDYVISPDSRWVLYLEDADGNGTGDVLMASALDGSVHPFLVNTGLGLGHFGKFDFTADGQFAVWMQDVDRDGHFELYARLLPEPASFVMMLGGWGFLRLRRRLKA